MHLSVGRSVHRSDSTTNQAFPTEGRKSAIYCNLFPSYCLEWEKNSFPLQVNCTNYRTIENQVSSLRGSKSPSWHSRAGSEYTAHVCLHKSLHTWLEVEWQKRFWQENSKAIMPVILVCWRNYGKFEVKKSFITLHALLSFPITWEAKHQFMQPPYGIYVLITNARKLVPS